MPRHHPSSDYERVAHMLGVRVAQLRGIRGLTQEALAERSGLSRNQVQNIERNRNNQSGLGNPRLETIVRLAVALEVDPTYLIAIDESMEPAGPKKPAKPVGPAKRAIQR